MQYWLVKSEPSCYAIEDLKRDRTTAWTDIRNYQARNYLRDMKKGDCLLFYHSSCAVPAIVGLARVEREGYPDPTQFDVQHEGYDPCATQENPRWLTVDVSFVEKFSEPLPLAKIKQDAVFAGMELIQRGSRLSVQPVSKVHFMHIMKLRSS